MKQLFLLLTLILLTNCNPLKQLQLMKSGKTAQKEFYVTIPFEFRAGLPVVEVEVNSIKAYFLFDTGAPNVISKELAKTLNLKTKATGNVEDSGGNNAIGQKYVLLDDITVGNINFLNTGAIIQDLKSSEAMSCIKLDGILGANLMKEAFWEINYQDHTITLTNDLSKLNVSEDHKPLKFKPKISSTPLVSLSLDGIEIKNITFDTGSNGHITLPKKVYHQLKRQSSTTTFSTGSTTYGINGKAKSDTTYFVKANTLKLGAITMSDKVIQFREHSDIIGTLFLENFNVILDWKSNTIYLKPIKKYDYDALNDFGFNFDLKDNKFLVGALFNVSDSNGKLQIGDEILQINDFDYASLSDHERCDLIINRKWDYVDSDQITIKIGRGEEVLNFEIQKLDLLK